MMSALFTAASGMKGQQLCIDTIANNLANVNTNGYKRSHLNFQDLLYNEVIQPGAWSAEDFQVPTGLQVGSGVRVVSTAKIFRQGDLEETGSELDLCIHGRGFFAVKMPDDTTAYTRDGAFAMNSQRQIVTQDGKPLTDNITLSSDATSISIGSDGQVWITTPGSAAMTSVGQITLTRFPNAAGLKNFGSNLFQETVASGAPTSGVPGQNGIGEIKQGFLERSNVEVVAELVKLITAQRAYEISSKAIRVSDHMLQAANNIVR